jgi:alpha-L-fucosidase 2
MQTGVATVSYTLQGARYTREHFFSEDPSVMVVHLYSNKKKKLNFSVGFQRGDSTIAMKPVNTSAGGSMMTGKGIDPECKQTIFTDQNTVSFEGQFIEGVVWGMKARLIQKGGKLSRSKDKLSINDADVAWILVSIATDSETATPFSRCNTDLQKAVKKLPLLKQEAVKKHSSYYNRVQLSLGKEKSPVMDAHQWLKQQRAKPDAALYEKLFNYGRYLLICSSRKGNLPANLQGIWNEDYKPAWDSDFHYDINQQMNYWMADVVGLPECGEPFFDFNTSILPKARANAKNIYGSRGVLFPIATDPYSAGSFFRGPWVAWTGGAAWVAQHYWDHWQYTNDTSFLKNRAYPFLKEVALFYEDFIYYDSLGRMTFFPSISPENGTIRPDSSQGTLCSTPTSDLALMSEVFTNLIAASSVLQKDARQRSAWKKMLTAIPPYPISAEGELLEFTPPFKTTSSTHRHLSHLHGIFPGEEIDVLSSNPQLVQAASKALQQRGLQATGWATIHRAAAWARLHDAEKALKCLDNFASGQITSNLMGLHDPWDGVSPAPRPFQIDCNLGVVRAITEMLVQSINGEIRLLPALPQSWSEGSIKNFRAKKGFVVSIEWEKGGVTKGTILPTASTNCVLRSSVPITVHCPGDKIFRPVTSLNGVVKFQATKGKQYHFERAKDGL